MQQELVFKRKSRKKYALTVQPQMKKIKQHTQKQRKVNDNKHNKYIDHRYATRPKFPHDFLTKMFHNLNMANLTS